MFKKSFIMMSILLLITAAAKAQETITMEPVVVTATRTETPLSQIASSITVISAEEIEKKQQFMVLDVLRSIPGVVITQSGPLGSQGSVRMRGTDNRHTLVLIDGIEYRDASTIGGGPDLANLNIDNIERIEVVRGPQSVLYGSDAIGGVINIITKKESSQPQAYASIEGGSYKTWRETAGFSVMTDVTTSSIAISRTDSDGFSSYNEKDGFTEKDGYGSTNISFNVGVIPSDFFTINMNLRLIDSSYDFDTGIYDEFFNYVRADTDAKVETLEVAGRTEVVLNLIDNKLDMVGGVSITNTDRETTGTYDNYQYDGRVIKFDLLSHYNVNDNNTLTAGIETEKEEYSSSYGDAGKVRSSAAFFQDQFNFKKFSAAVGLRHDEHDEFGGKTTWRIAPTYIINKIASRLKASVGTGFKAPSLFQLYNPYGGNENLEPETSFGWDIGVEQSLFKRSLIIDVSYFHNDIDDYIDWFGSEYQNINKLKTKGLESFISWYPSVFFDIQLSYTYTDTEDGNGEEKALIPLHKGSLTINLYPVENVQVGVDASYTGDRNDGATKQLLKAYTLVNLATSYQVTDNFKLFGRIDNLFDKDYEEVAGYGTAGLSGYAGVKLSF